MCECLICKYDKKVQSTIKSEDPKQMKELILELYDNMRQAEDNVDYYRCIMRGDWPGSKEIAIRILKHCEELENARPDPVC